MDLGDCRILAMTVSCCPFKLDKFMYNEVSITITMMLTHNFVWFWKCYKDCFDENIIFPRVMYRWVL